MNLHDVKLANIEAVAWLYPIGGNGQLLTPTFRGSWSPIFHAYNVQRANPPVGDNGWMRRNWHPWNGGWGNPNWGANPLRPLCGQIKSRARKATLRAAGTGYPGDRYCLNCLNLAPTATYMTILQQRDPWTQIAYHERGTAVDPITGL